MGKVNVNGGIGKLKKTLWPLFMDVAELSQATELLRGDSFLFTTQFPGVPGTHLIDFGRMKS